MILSNIRIIVAIMSRIMVNIGKKNLIFRNQINHVNKANHITKATNANKAISHVMAGNHMINKSSSKSHAARNEISHYPLTRKIR